MTALTRLHSHPAHLHSMEGGGLRQIYQQLLGDSSQDAGRELALEFLRDRLDEAAALPEELPDSLGDLASWVEQRCQIVAGQYAEYLHERQAGGPRRFFSNKAHALYFLQTVAPTKLVDGAWLNGTLAHWHDHRYEGLLRTYLEELGDGNPVQNHVVLYRKLLAEYDLDTHAVADEHFLQGAIQLALGQCLDECLPEVIGYNLGYEQLPLHLLISAYELSELGIDPYYFTLHVTIDNASTGHAQKAVQALMQLLPVDADRDEFLRRVSLGYRLNDLGQGSGAVIDGFDLQAELLDMLERKRPFGQHMHSDYCRFEGKTVNQWLAEPDSMPGFLAALEQKGWIKRGQDPQDSRFWTLIDGDGAAMFGVFSPYEKQLLHDWIAADWVAPSRKSARRGKVAATSLPGTLGDPDLQALERALRGLSADQQIALLMPWLSTARHSHPAGLFATRRFIELKSQLR